MSLTMIDPGHGGNDPGAVANGLKEKELNLLIAAGLYSLLQKAQLEARFTRADDRLVSLKARCEMANNLKAGLFISIHCNASTEAGAKGIEVFHSPGSEAGQSLAGSIYDALAALGRQMRGVKAEGFYVLRHTLMPACLVECGFITNPEEALWLKTHTSESAQAIAQGIINHIKREAL